MSRVSVDIEEFKASSRRCPIPPAVELIAEKWAFLILRGAMYDLRHFEQFQEGLGIARNILSDRLRKLVDAGILERRTDPRDKRRIVYTLTDKGEALLPVLVSLRQWAERFVVEDNETAIADERDALPIRQIEVCAHDGRPLSRDELVWRHRRTGEILHPAAAFASARGE